MPVTGGTFQQANEFVIVSLKKCTQLVEVEYQVGMAHDDDKRMIEQLATISSPHLTTIRLGLYKPTGEAMNQEFWSQLDNLLISAQFSKLKKVIVKLRFLSTQEEVNFGAPGVLLRKLQQRGVFHELERGRWIEANL